ncbi:MAG: hypothetical protein GY797_18730 [Deltaproteobacteria bacterium]|nr:hypothetical protein [Deltaproteobacteria bacterium]
MNKTYQTLLVLLILTSLNVLLTFNNGYAGLIIKQLKTGLIVKLKTDIDTQIIRVGGLIPEKIVITAETREQNLQFTWNIDGPGKLLETTTNQNVYIPPDKIDEAAAQTAITVTATDDQGNQGGDELTFTLIPFSTQEQLIRLKVKLNTEKYEALIKQEQQGVSVTDQIIPILEEIIEGLKETKEIYEKLSQTHPEILQELNQTQYTIKRFEKGLFNRLSPTPTPIPSPEIRITIKNGDGKIRKPVEDVYFIKVKEVVTITVDIANLPNRYIEIGWSSGRGRIEEIDKKTTTYTTPTTIGGDYITVNVLDPETGKAKDTTVTIEVKE